MTDELSAIEMNKVEAKLAHAEQSRGNVLLTTRELRALVEMARRRCERPDACPVKGGAK